MGTSVSHSSPATPNWRAAVAAYVTGAIPTPRVVQEIWRAATNQPLGDLRSDLSASVIAQCLNIALETRSPEEAYHVASRMISLSGHSTLATEMAKRAAIHSFKTSENRRLNFVVSLFSEAVNYLVSRDIPGYVGAEGRITNVSASIDFKKRVREQVERTVREHPVPIGIEKDHDKWKVYVESVVQRLSGKQ